MTVSEQVTPAITPTFLDCPISPWFFGLRTWVARILALGVAFWLQLDGGAEALIAEMPAVMPDAYELTLALRGQVPVPHKTCLADPTLSRGVVPMAASHQTRSTLTKVEIGIATDLINAPRHAAYTNREHEKIADDAGHLPANEVQAMIAGLPTQFDEPRWPVVYEPVSALVGRRVVPTGPFKRARTLLGGAGIVDMTVLLGWFTGVSLTLAAIDVPSDATGLAQ